MHNPRKYRFLNNPYHGQSRRPDPKPVVDWRPPTNHEAADHFITAGLSVTQALIASLAAEKRDRPAPQFSAGFMAARRRNGQNPFRRSYSAAW
jgi:hypothetical protein